MTIPTRTIQLRFDPRFDTLPSGKKLSGGMSCAVAVGRFLWLAHDETLAVERLSVEHAGTKALRFAGHRSFALKDLITLPMPQRRNASAPEADLEGISFCDGYLWLAGSHSAVRDEAKGQSASDAIESLARIRRAGNRFILARIPLSTKETELEPVKRCRREDGEVLRAATLAGGRKNDALTTALKRDPHLAPFLGIPSKDNGFDIEGIAAGPGGRLFLGLRGPVIDGWACVLELQIDADLNRRRQLKLLPLRSRRTSTATAPFRKHFLDLSGAGIRDLCLVGLDLLILTGPPMRGKGESQVRIWKNALASDSEHLVKEEHLPVLLELPYREKKDHAEGIAVLDWNLKQVSLMVIYDSVSKGRRTAAGTMSATLHQVMR